MTFREHYYMLKKLERPIHPAKEFILMIAEKTGKKPATVQQWVCGIQTPGEETQTIISNIIGIPKEELFPTINCKAN